jgi:predicted ATP-grasp superfamily ATP-dependent carboligase
MRIFIDEFLTSGAMFSRSDWGDCPSLKREGAAMAQAVSADFAALEGVEVLVKQDARLPALRFPECIVTYVQSADEDQKAFRRLAAEADWTLVIAPEIDGMLLDRCQQAVAAGGRLLGPDLETIAWASDKQRTAEWLARHGIAAPEGRAIEPKQSLPAHFGYPAILKPRDGAGSLGIRSVADACQASQMDVDCPSRLERFCPGHPCSVSLLVGRRESIALPPFSQRLSQDGHFRYLGGERLADPGRIKRAQQLALRAAKCFSLAIGYVGLDMVLADGDDASEDRLIEVNPRLTTSYLGLRRAVDGNLAAALLAAATERPILIQPTDAPIAFSAAGTVGTVFDSSMNVT